VIDENGKPVPGVLVNGRFVPRAALITALRPGTSLIVASTA
jgi:hypothetical protein